MDQALEFGSANPVRPQGSPPSLHGRRATTLVVSDVGCDCSTGLRQALREDRDLAVILRAPHESVGVFAQRVAARVRKMPFPVADAFVGPHRWGAEHASFVRRLAGCLPAGATLTMCSDGPTERLRCQATADVLAEIDHPPIAIRAAAAADGPSTSRSPGARLGRARRLKPLRGVRPPVDAVDATKPLDGAAWGGLAGA